MKNVTAFTAKDAKDAKEKHVATQIMEGIR